MRILERKSNYLVVQVSPGVRVLFSYTTPVAAYVDGRGYVRSDRGFSRTTNKHIGQFLDGAKAETIPHAEFEILASEGGY